MKGRGGRERKGAGGGRGGGEENGRRQEGRGGDGCGMPRSFQIPEYATGSAPGPSPLFRLATPRSS